MGEEPPGIPEKDVLLTWIHLNLFKEFPDVFFRSALAFHEDHSEDFHQQPALRVAPARVNPAIVGKAQHAEKVVE